MKKIDKITEIRIEEVIDEENNENYYWVYFVRNGKIEIFAGIYDQRVNFMHAVNFYNMLAIKSNLEEIIEKEILEFFEKNEDHIASYDEIIFYKKD